MTTGTLFTLGYSAQGAEARLIELMGTDLHASPIKTLLVDIRFSPRSKRFPEWSAGALHSRWHHCYWQLGHSLGNENFHDKALPIKLAKPEPGIKHICWHLRRGTNVILLCACADESRCHRLIVAKMVQEA